MEAFAWYLEKEGTQLGTVEASTLLEVRLRKEAFRRDMDTAKPAEIRRRRSRDGNPESVFQAFETVINW